MPIWNCDKRFQIIKAHRRFGKTKLAFNRLVKQVLIACAKRRPQESLISAYYFFPTLRLAREVVWDNLRKLHIPAEWPQNTNNMVIELPGSGMIYVSGCDDTVKRGFNPSFVVFDEWAEVRDSGIWPEVVRPVLAENGGSATFIYTPKGRNHAWELSKKTAGREDWEHFTNFCLVLDRDSLGLFAWLCYRADMSNKVEWGISEIEAYRTYLGYLKEEYTTCEVKVSEKVIRRVFKGLCETGLVLGDGYINPLFSYPDRRKSEYKRVAALWEKGDKEGIINICKTWKTTKR